MAAYHGSPDESESVDDEAGKSEVKSGSGQVFLLEKKKRKIEECGKDVEDKRYKKECRFVHLSLLKEVVIFSNSLWKASLLFEARPPRVIPVLFCVSSRTALISLVGQ